MPVILCIETATSVCSAALSKDGIALAVRESDDGNKHAELLTVFIGELFKETGLSMNELDAVAVSHGPGSYTGLRIGASTAKGLCYGLNKPLISVSTLQSMANLASQKALNTSSALLCPMIDARRMEVYCAIYDNQLKEVSPVEAHVVGADSFSTFLAQNTIIFSGNGAKKCEPLLKNSPNAVFIDVSSSAKGMIALAEEKFLRKEFEDVSLFEPFYLKDVHIGGK